MDYIRETIEYLKNYDSLKQSLINLEMDIKELKSNLDVGKIGAINYSDMPKGSNAQLPGDDVINNIYRLKVKREEYAITKKTLEKMDKTLAALDPYYAKILRAYYIDGLREESLYKHTNCSERNFYRSKNTALRVFAVQLHGINAIK